MDKIPIVDLKPIQTENPSESDWNSVTKLVGEAMHKVGFVYLINHGVDESKVRNKIGI